MAGSITKKIRGNKYTYFEYHENGRTIQKYCGPDGSAESKKKAMKYEYEILKIKRDRLNERMRKIRKRLTKART